MNKTDLLFQMMEHPQDYTEEQWQEILANKECRELYTMMSKVQNAYDAQRNISDETINEEWQRLSNERKTIISPFFKIAAMFIGVLMLSGIAVAAIHIIRHQSHVDNQQPQTELLSDQEKLISYPVVTIKTDTLVTVQPIIFDNVPLEKMLLQIAEKYGVEVEFHNPNVRQLRFYFVWEQDKSINVTLHQLNLFESVTITLKDNKIVVE